MMMKTLAKLYKKKSPKKGRGQTKQGARSKQANCPKEAGPLRGKGTNKQIIKTSWLKLREKDAYFLLTK